jgi:hypothetical protein
MKRVTFTFIDDGDRETVEEMLIDNGYTTVLPEYPHVSESEINVLVPDECVADAEDEDE